MISGTTAHEIAASIERAIVQGPLEPGQGLPTIRELATTLGTSPATVNAAYRTLRQRGLVVTGGRRGTRVARRPPLRAPSSSPPPGTAPPGVRDLAIGLPDLALLPSLPVALAKLELEPRLRITGLETPDQQLLETARAAFAADGLPGEHIAVLSGALDATERVLGAHLRLGDRVIIEDPAYPPIRDILLALGMVAVPVAVDERGLVPEALKAALATGPAALVIVPRAQNPLGAAMDADRAGNLRELIDRHHPALLVVEDDHAGAVAGAPLHSLVPPSGRPAWAVIRSMSKILHPDMRLALVAGDETTIGRVEGRQALGPRWVSHILQALTAEVLGDPGFAATCARASAAYAERRENLVQALAAHGITAFGRTGMNVWVRVREETPVVRALFEAGWLVMSGENFRMASEPGIRITVSSLEPAEPAEIARVIAQVEGTGRRRGMY